MDWVKFSKENTDLADIKASKFSFAVSGLWKFHLRALQEYDKIQYDKREWMVVWEQSNWSQFYVYYYMDLTFCMKLIQLHYFRLKTLLTL